MATRGTSSKSSSRASSRVGSQAIRGLANLRSSPVSFARSTPAFFPTQSKTPYPLSLITQTAPRLLGLGSGQSFNPATASLLGAFQGAETAQRAGTAPNLNQLSPTGAGTPPTGSYNQPSASVPTQPQEQTLGQVLDLPGIAAQVIQILQQKGLTINPNVKFDESAEGTKNTASFLAQAEQYAQDYLDPYYATQLKLAREDFMRGLGFAEEEIKETERQAQLSYSQSLRKLGEQSAETGFAQSGLRKQAESSLADVYQSEIDRRRRQFGFETSQKASDFARQFGQELRLPENLRTIEKSPRFLPGQEDLQRTGDRVPVYDLSQNIYQNLKGQQQYEREAAKQSRASELERAARQQEEINRIRSLSF